MTDKLDMAIVEGVATLLSQKAATHPQFFETLIVSMEALGYTINAEQRGAQGTHLRVSQYVDARKAPYWQCQSCGYKDRMKAMPKDREAYYRNPKPAKCPACKSEDMAPIGF